MVEVKKILKLLMKKPADSSNETAKTEETKTGKKKTKENKNGKEAIPVITPEEMGFMLHPGSGLDFMDDLEPGYILERNTAEAAPKDVVEEDPEAGFKLVVCAAKLREMPVYMLENRERSNKDVTACEVVHGSVRDFLSAKKMPVQKGKYACEIVLDEDTVRLFTEDKDHCFYVYYEHKETIYRYADSENVFSFPCKAIVGESVHWIFSGISDLKERAGSIRTYGKLTPMQQAYVRRRAAMKSHTEDRPREIHKPFMNKKQLKMLYAVCKESFSPEKQQKIEQLLSEASDYNRQDDALRQLSYFLGIDTCPVKRDKRSYDEIIAIMDRHIYGRDDLKAMIAECIIEAQYMSAQYFSILLIGSPGVGKTNFSEALCEVFESDMIFIDCGIIQPLDLFGVVKSYKDAQPSKVAQEFWSLGHTNAVVILDEIDKMITEDRDGNGFSALLKPLGPQRKYHDDYLNDDIDVSNCKFVCTANDYNCIPDYIIDRFEGRVVFVSDYSYEEKAEIGKKFVLPRELREHHIDPADLTITDEAMLLMAREYCSDKGAREITGNIRTIFRKVITEWERGLLSKPTVVDETYVRSHLLKKPQATFGFSA